MIIEQPLRRDTRLAENKKGKEETADNEGETTEKGEGTISPLPSFCPY